ncbi:abasic site processing protein HMCES isoform X2 [Marmota monax]|uniref:abasic site processing protein HMCES isoform X2 n=1 Tax=Marmota monax TaxID=9995 RepID=UPI0026F281CB|nr:abasic site processing protein HMCES isoform X2 [Marmota monax]
MCGRTSCHLPRDVLTRACAYHDRQGQQRLPEWRDPEKYYPSYNKSPQSSSPVLLSRLHLEKGADSSERVIAPMRWGLVPCWFKEADLSKMPFNITNCRSDTILEKRSFKVPLGKGRRCVVLADGFYEWQRSQVTSQSQPYFIYFPQVKTEKDARHFGWRGGCVQVARLWRSVYPGSPEADPPHRQHHLPPCLLRGEQLPQRHARVCHSSQPRGQKGTQGKWQQPDDDAVAGHQVPQKGGTQVTPKGPVRCSAVDQPVPAEESTPRQESGPRPPRPMAETGQGGAGGQASSLLIAASREAQVRS